LTRDGVFDMKFTSEFTASTSIDTNSSIYIRGSSFLALRTVTDIGPNIAAWFENGSNEGADEGSVRLYKAPVVIKTMIVTPELDPNSVDCFESGLDVAPEFDSCYGNAANNYFSTYLFRTPMVIRYKVSGATKYAVFNTQFEGNT
jgi:hypothetical protein